MTENKNNKISLIIVESPAKCKTIEKLLGPGYKCIATFGHLRQLSSLEDIDINHSFKPKYSVDKTKSKFIENIRNEISLADEVLISSDSDREGEMIGFSIIELFKLPLNTKRITFNEITESALRNAIQNPRTIDMNLVYAQQARQILDVIIGFKVSPVLWNKISTAKGKNKSLSAGRCQTPALKLVYENQLDIRESIGKMVYSTTGYFTNLNLPFKLNTQFEDESKIKDFLNKSVDFQHIYTCSQPIQIIKQAPEPFTTSRLQQVASNELHYSPKETMRICQLLYEGGYITYMRTDSNTYCDDFLEEVNNYITRTYNNEGEKYMREPNNNNKKSNKKDKNKTQDKGGVKPQEAHEAIRPSHISLQFQDLPEELDSKEKKMYKLIWTNALESCMTAATYYSITASINYSLPPLEKLEGKLSAQLEVDLKEIFPPAFLKVEYTYTSELIDFPGWKIVENKFSRENKEYQYLQTIKMNSVISYKKITSNVVLKGSKLHYTEAKLVNLLEEKGIGRPSTFASIIDKILERGYVKKEDIKGKEFICKEFELNNDIVNEIEVKREFGNEKGKLVVQPLGEIVMAFLDKHFNSLFDYEYTSLMELNLDKISKDQMIWSDVCDMCNKEVDDLIKCIQNEPKIEFKIDDNNTYMIGKYGPVIKCVDEKKKITFKAVNKDLDIDITKLKNREYKLEDIISLEKNEITTEELNTEAKKHIFGKYEDKEVVLHKGKFGLYASWGDKTKTLKELGNRPIENITFEEVNNILNKVSTGIIRVITPELSIRNGPKGDYLFYKNAKMKKPTFHDIKTLMCDSKEDYKICDINILKSIFFKDGFNNKN